METPYIPTTPPEPVGQIPEVYTGNAPPERYVYGKKVDNLPMLTYCCMNPRCNNHGHYPVVYYHETCNKCEGGWPVALFNPVQISLTLGPKATQLLAYLHTNHAGSTPAQALFEELRHACAMARSPDGELTPVEQLAAEAANEARQMGI